MRAVARIDGASFNTVAKLLTEAADAADAYHDEHVRGIRGHRHIQCDEIWAFVHCNDSNLQFATKAAPEVAGDAWTWTALDTKSKLIVSYTVSLCRVATTALRFIGRPLSSAQPPGGSSSALYGRVECVPRGNRRSLWRRHGLRADHQDLRQGRREPTTSVATARRPVRRHREGVVQGPPDLDAANTSYVEGHNLKMRMSMRRFTRLTNGFSKQLEKHAAMLSLYFFWYNNVRPNSAVRTKLNNRVTPAMAAGLADRPQPRSKGWYDSWMSGHRSRGARRPTRSGTPPDLQTDALPKSAVNPRRFVAISLALLMAKNTPCLVVHFSGPLHWWEGCNFRGKPVSSGGGISGVEDECG